MTSFYWSSLCPHCKYGMLRFWRASHGFKFLLCDECESNFANPSEFKNIDFIVPKHPYKGTAGSMTLEEIKEAGWEKHIQGFYK